MSDHRPFERFFIIYHWSNCEICQRI